MKDVIAGLIKKVQDIFARPKSTNFSDERGKTAGKYSKNERALRIRGVRNKKLRSFYPNLSLPRDTSAETSTGKA